MYRQQNAYGYNPPGGNSIFGRPIESVIVDGVVPDVLEAMLQTVSRPGACDFFAVNQRDPQIDRLKQAVEQTGTHALGQASPALVGALLVRFYCTLPIPLIPMKYAGNVQNIASVASGRARLELLRTFFAMLPEGARTAAARLFAALQASQGNPKALGGLFAPAFSQDNLSATITECIANGSYIALADPQPRVCDSVPPTGAEQRMQAKVMYDYNSTAPNAVSLRVGEVVTVYGAFPEGWLEGDVNGRHGFLPGGFVELIPQPLRAAQYAQPTTPQGGFPGAPGFDRRLGMGNGGHPYQPQPQQPQQHFYNPSLLQSQRL